MMKIPPLKADSLAGRITTTLYKSDDIHPAGNPIYDLESGQCLGRIMPPINLANAGMLQPWSKPDSYKGPTPHHYRESTLAPRTYPNV